MKIHRLGQGFEPAFLVVEGQQQTNYASDLQPPVRGPDLPLPFLLFGENMFWQVLHSFALETLASRCQKQRVGRTGEEKVSFIVASAQGTS
ncbi:hypothetical protein TNCV_1974511 [Trichonephila clavipes]|nr:hypothetical protein TNCV_1974511 [Trichonephila clavipes]